MSGWLNRLTPARGGRRRVDARHPQRDEEHSPSAETGPTSRRRSWAPAPRRGDRRGIERFRRRRGRGEMESEAEAEEARGDGST